MTSLAHIRKGLNRIWDNVAEGWEHLRERATHAITRFTPSHKGSEVETAQDRIMQRGARWGLLTAEVQEKKDHVVVNLEAPGMDAEDFDLSVVDDYLVIRGEKHAQREHTEGRYHIMECAYGSFERAVPLPASVEEDKAKASYKRGVLSVTLPKNKHTQNRRIEVKAL